MKILMMVLRFPPAPCGGAEMQCWKQARALASRGHEVTVFSQSGASADSQYEVVVVPPRKRLRTFLFAWDLRRYDFSSH